ncbi:MAG: SMC family ATPase [Candidatus Micrarchaeota archaeon]
MIKLIRLINWRSHSDTALTFHKGTNLLVGIMGAGKSSILEGISFALFGTFPAIERRKLKIENIIRLNEPNAKVVLEFEWNGNNYRVERNIERSKKGSSSTAEVYKDNSLVEHGQTPSSLYIQNLIGVDYDLFTRAIYSEQNNVDHFLNLDPRRRKDEIDCLLGLDKFELARANIVTVINQLRSKHKTLEEKLNKKEIEEAEKNENRHKELLVQIEKNLKELQVSYGQKTKELTSVSTTFENMKKEKEIFEKLDRELLKLSTQCETLSKELENKKIDNDAKIKLENNLTILSELRSKSLHELQSIDKEFSRLSKELGSTESKLKLISQNNLTIAKLENEFKSLPQKEQLIQKQKECEQLLLSYQSEKNSLERELTEIKDLIPKLKTGISKCPLCSSDLNDQAIEHIKTEKEDLIKNKSTGVGELSNLILSTKKTHESFSQDISKSILLTEKLSLLQAELKDNDNLPEAKKKIETNLLEFQNKKRTTQKTIDDATGNMETIRQELTIIKNLIIKKTDLDKTTTQLSEIKSKLVTVKFNVKQFDELRSIVEKLRIDVELANASKKSLEEKLLNTQEILKLIHEKLIIIKSVEAEIVSLAKLEEELAIYKNALQDTQIALRVNLIDAINSAMNEVWPIFYPYKNYHALRLGVSEKDYIFEVNDGNNWKALETMASGGERACAALALRVAFAMVLTPNLSWLILDEPTHNLDSEAVELLSSALQYKVPEVVKQIFIITHDEGFMGSEFASSYRLSRDKSINGETKVTLQ